MKNTLILILLSLILITATTAHPLITAISYDPPGADSGYEWVELFNPTNESLILTNYSLGRGNGANEDDWTLIWSNSSFRMQPHTFYTVGEEQVSLADELTPLKLQNGPDALRLQYENTTIETLGWGEHEYDEYYQVKPTDDKTSSVLVRNFTIENNDVVFSQTRNNNIDFSFEDERQPHNQYFSLSELLIPADATTDVSYVLTIVNQKPVMHGIELLVADVSQQNGLQLVVPESSLLRVRVFADDGNGQSDIDSLKYELQYDGKTFVEGEVNSFTNRTNESFELNIPFLTSYPSGLYTLLLTAEDSQHELSKTAGVQFELFSILGVNVQNDVLVFESNADATNYTTVVSLENSGNIDSKLDFVFESDMDLSTIYFVEGVQIKDDSVSLLRPGEQANVTVVVKPLSTLRAGRYTGLFRVIVYEVD